MAKASVAGTVKTRLVPPLTDAEAAELNTCFLTDVAGNILAAANQVAIQAFVAYHPLGSEEFFSDLLPGGFKLLPPREPTIGRSLFHAAQDLLTAGYGSVCLINADSPTLPTDILVETVRQLEGSDDRIVIGPAVDGGYYLIGLNRFYPRLFEEIDWSTHRVFRQTLERANEIGVAAAVLPEWYDVDDAPTLATLVHEIRMHQNEGSPYRSGYEAPCTSAFLERLASENGGLRRLLDCADPLRSQPAAWAGNGVA
jgi:rSAM/selenodomain-associated transferase 1